VVSRTDTKTRESTISPIVRVVARITLLPMPGWRMTDMALIGIRCCGRKLCDVMEGAEVQCPKCQKVQKAKRERRAS